MIVGDVVISGTGIFRITGIYIAGDKDRQNLIGLESVNKKPGYVHTGDVKEMLVPEDLISASSIYRKLA